MTSSIFNVRWTAIARADLASIIRYIAADNPLEASRVLARIKKKAETLVVFPERGRIIPELREVGVYTHQEIISKPWRIMYRVEAQIVFVVAVLDSRRQLQDLLLERLTSA